MYLLSDSSDSTYPSPLLELLNKEILQKQNFTISASQKITCKSVLFLLEVSYYLND
jgi:hypothetical protein